MDIMRRLAVLMVTLSLSKLVFGSLDNKTFNANSKMLAIDIDDTIGEFFVATDNKISKISPNFTILQNFTIGKPFIELQQKCPNIYECDGKESIRLKLPNKITLLKSFRDQGKAFVFVALLYGNERFFLVDVAKNLVTPVRFKEDNRTYHNISKHIFSNDSLQYFFCDSKRNSISIKHLCISRDVKHNAHYLTAYPISVFKLDIRNNDKPILSYLEDKPWTAFKVHSTLAVDILHGFYFNENTYYVQVHNGLVTLLQVFIENERTAKIRETRLRCSDYLNVTDAVAYLIKDDKTGPGTQNGGILYLVYNNDKDHSALCELGFTEIEDYFEQVEEDCKKGIGSYPEWLDHGVNHPACFASVSVMTYFM